MSTELRFLLAILLMLGVLVGTNIMFPPVAPEGEQAGDSVSLVDGAATNESPTDAETSPGFDPARGIGGDETAGGPVGDAAGDTPSLPERPAVIDVGATPGNAGGAGGVQLPTAAEPERTVVAEGPLYRFEFSTRGARLLAAELTQFDALNREGLVDLVPEGGEGYLSQRLVVGTDTVDLRSAPYRVEPADGIRLASEGESGTLRFIYEHPSGELTFTVAYTFHGDRYMVDVSGSVEGLRRPLLVTTVGDGLAFAEADSASEVRTMAYVQNHLQDGIKSTLLEKAEPTLVQGPLLWTAVRSKFFVLALLAGESEEAVDETSYLGGLLVGESTLPGRVRIDAAQTVGDDGAFAYRLFMGPQEYARLSSLGQGMEEVNPYGWRFFRPIIRPFVSIIMGVLVFLHTTLNIGYGWVLMIVGVLMRVLLFPLNHKAMRAQLRNMAVQPLVTEIQAKYKDNPEKLQKEMMKLYKEHGFNPLAGCLPMLLPWPMLIALFFVFQNTIELRGVPFLWLADLSAKDPLYILPVILAVSMFLMQWVSMRSLEQANPQMKMMMWMMPGMMLFIFLNLASGLNLYYATTNIATIPQQVWIANERKKMKGKPPPKLSSD